MAGRPITRNTPRAIQRREQMRRKREEMRVQQATFNPRPLAQVIKHWRAQ